MPPELTRLELDPLPVSFGPHEADWWMVGLTALGILATLAIALLTLRANRTAAVAQRIATEAHTEALQATKLSSERQVATLEAIVVRLNATTEHPAPTTDVRWHLESDLGRGRWLIRNLGTATAYSAYLEAVSESGAWALSRPLELPIDVAPNEYIEFGVLPPHAPLLLEVTWADDLENPQAFAFVVAE